MQEAQTRHYTWPTAMGRTMTTTLLMGSMLKGEQKLTVTVDGKGPIGRIIADADLRVMYVRMWINHKRIFH